MRKHLLALLLILTVIIGACDRRSASQIYSDAEDQISQDKFEQAIKDLQRIEKKFADNELTPKAVYRIAELYMNELKDLESAIETYKHVADSYKDSEYGPKSRFMAGFLLANNTSRFDEARAQYEIFLNEYPENELSSAVNFEMENLGKDIDDIPELKGLINADAQGADK